MKTYIFIALTIVGFKLRVSHSCPEGYFGAGCSSLCHCDSGPEVCSSVDGACSMGLCERGWTSLPHCQTSCPDGTFGLNCNWQCHCPADDTCSKVNGLCDGGHCEYGWSGPSCQTRLPMFSCPANITTITKSSITVTWRRWNPTFDIGMGPIVYYLLEYQSVENQNTWTEATSRVESPGADFYVHIINNLQPETAYRFRITLGMSMDDKWVKSIPGNPTAWKYTLSSTTSGAVILIPTTPTTPSTTTAFISTPSPPMPNVNSTSNETVTISSSTTSTEEILVPVLENIVVETVTDSTTIASQAPVPLVVKMLERNTTSLSVQWKTADGSRLPSYDKYKVTVKLKSSHSGAPYHETVSETTLPTLTLLNLSPASLYIVRVEPVEGHAASVATAELWTEPKQPPMPEAPEFLNSSDTSIWLNFYGVSVEMNDLITYEIVVENVSMNNGTLLSNFTLLEMNAFQLLDYWNAIRQSQNPNIYTSAQLTNTDLSPSGTEFEVGDADTYDGYYNAPLDPASQYAIWIACVASLDGVVKKSITRSEFVVIPSIGIYVAHVEETKTGGISLIAIVVPVVIVIFLLLVAIAVGIFLWQKKKNKEEHMYGDILTYHQGPNLYDKYFNLMKAKATRQKKYHDTLHKIHRKMKPKPNHGKSVYIPTLEPQMWERSIGDDIHRQTTVLTSTPRISGQQELYSTMPEKIDFENTGPEIRIPKTPGVHMEQSYLAIKKSNPINVSDLRRYVIEREATDYTIAEEFRHLPIGMMESVNTALSPQHAMLNRTSQVLPYDKNRIRLKSIIPDAEPDFINASLVKTHINTFFIVTQCPMDTTMGEFWRMIWDENVTTVVALMAMREEGKPEYEQYWPDAGEKPKFYHDISVSCIATEKCANYHVRKFTVSRMEDGEEHVRAIFQYQYVSWTKGGVPIFAPPFLDFVDRIREKNFNFRDQARTLVLCHSGSGRSGMYIALDSLISEGESTGKVDVLKCVTTLRLERPNLVKQRKQYEFLYHSLCDFFMYHNTNIHADSFGPVYDNILNVNMNNARCPLALEFEALDTGTTANAFNKNSILKDYSMFISPIKKTATFKLEHSDDIVRPNGGSDSSSALLVAYLDSFKDKGTFIICRHPGKGQIEEFWNIINENSCAGIVTLNGDDIQCARFVPGNGKELITGEYVISSKTHKEHTSRFETTDLTLQRTQAMKKGLNLQQFCFSNWAGHQETPSISQMVKFVNLIRQWKSSVSGTRPVMVVSNRGPGRAVLFCVVWSLLERIEMEGVVNVLRTVHQHRIFMPTVVNSAGQYRFLYCCIKKHLDNLNSTNDTGLNASSNNNINTEDTDSASDDQDLVEPFNSSSSENSCQPDDSSHEDKPTSKQLILPQVNQDREAVRVGVKVNVAERRTVSHVEETDFDIVDIEDNVDIDEVNLS